MNIMILPQNDIPVRCEEFYTKTGDTPIFRQARSLPRIKLPDILPP